MAQYVLSIIYYRNSKKKIKYINIWNKNDDDNKTFKVNR